MSFFTHQTQKQGERAFLGYSFLVLYRLSIQGSASLYLVEMSHPLYFLPVSSQWLEGPAGAGCQAGLPLGSHERGELASQAPPLS